MQTKFRSWHRYWGFAALAATILTLLFAGYGWLDRQAALRMGESQARQISEQTALIANGALQASHQLIHAMELLARPSGVRDRQSISRRLIELRALNPQIDDLLIIDGKGQIAYWTRDSTPPDVSDRDYVTHHARNGAGRLYVSEPLQSRARPGHWFLALSEALRDANGAVEFVLVVIIEAEGLSKVMAVDMAIPESSQVLMSQQGRIFARRPDHAAHVGRQVSQEAILGALSAENPVITRSLVSQLDQHERIVSFRRLAGYPLVAAGSIDTQQLLVPWHERMRALAGLWAALVAGIVWSFAEIIRRDRRITLALKEADRFRKALDHVPAYVYIKDVDLRYVYGNKRTLELFGCDGNGLVGADDNRFFPPDAAARIRQIDRGVIAGRSSTEEIDVPDGAGGHRAYLEVKTPLRDPEEPQRIVGLCGISTEITNLKDQQAKLEATVAQRTRDLSEAKNLADAANRAKTSFLANVGHELRTPLNGVLGMIGIVLRRQTDPRTAHHLEVAKESAEQLLAMLNDILEFAKLEADQLTLSNEPFDLAALIENVRFQHASAIDEKALTLLIELPPELSDRALSGDPLRLRRVIGSLLANAIKFSEDGEIRLGIAILDQTDTSCRLRFEISDQGIGIDRDDQARLFSAFEQADGSMTRKYGGAGLGLAICKRLVAMMEGEIGVDSRLGEGSTFRFTARFEWAALDPTQSAQFGSDLPRASPKSAASPTLTPT
jgi:PAS domain S-box-containing protein